MSITPLKRVTLCGLTREKRALLEGLQDLGCMHLVPLRAAPSEVEKIASPHAEGARKALNFLRDVPRKRKQVVRDKTFDVSARVQEILALRQKLREVNDRRDYLEHQIEVEEPWGDFELPPKEVLGGNYLWFYVLPLRQLKSLDDVHLPWQIVGKDNRLAYVVVISPKEPPSDLLPVSRIMIGAKSLSELRMKLEETEIELEELDAQREALTRYNYLLSVNLAEAENQAHLRYAEQQTRDEDAVVAVQGWVPVDALSAVEAFAAEHKLACLFEDPTPKDDPPTLVDQPDDMQAGADLTMFYQVPSYRSWDPTVILFASFSIFFAMILADAGYGLLLLAGLLFFWRRLGRSSQGRSYRLLGLALFGCTIVYGVMVGSYFGVSPEEGSFLDRLHILSVNDFETMMKISIIIGVVHICIANGMMAYVNRAKRSKSANIGWNAVLIGGLVFWLSNMIGPWASFGIVLAIVGFILVVWFSSDRPITKPSDHAWRVFDGVQQLGGAMGAFGDVLSYMRLFALGLASASLAITFNDLAVQVKQASPGLGILLAVLILIVGHALNLALSLMSGVVHGLRLNFIEFYKWGFPDEGMPFKRFARKEVQS